MFGHECGREGCERRTDRVYCTPGCHTIANELTRLQELYLTADDPDLDRGVWATLVELSDRWTEYQRARGLLVRDIRARGLRLP